MINHDTARASLAIQLFNKYEKIDKNDIGYALKLERLCYYILKKTIEQCLDPKIDVTTLDPIIGDSNCQIRSDKLLDIFPIKEKLREEMNWIYSQINSALDKIGKINLEVKTFQEAQEFKRKLAMGFSNFLEQAKIPKIILSDDMKFLFQMHITSYYYAIDQKQRNLLQERLTNKFGLTINFINDCINRAKKILNNTTNKHIMFCANKVINNIPEKSNYVLLNALEQIEEKGNLTSHSIFIGFKFLIKHWWLKKIPLILITKILCKNNQHGIHTIYQTYIPINNFDNYEYLDDVNIFSGKPKMVFKGISDLKGIAQDFTINEIHDYFYVHKQDQDISCPDLFNIKEQIKKIGIKNIILANAACHYQYVDKTKEIDFASLGETGKYLKEEFEQFFQLAYQEGLSLSNPSIFRLIHVYPSII